LQAVKFEFPFEAELRMKFSSASSSADWVSVCRGKDILRGGKQRLCFEGRVFLISRLKTGKVVVLDEDEDDKCNFSKVVASASRSGEPLKSWPVREAEGFIKVFVGRSKGGQVVDGDGHDLPLQDIERFLNVELSSGCSRFNVPEDVQVHLNASIHLHERSKKRYPNDMQVFYLSMYRSWES
jgi:hypothetical protein